VNEPILLTSSESPAILVLTLNRPQKRNALSLELIEQVTAAVSAANGEPNRRVLILRGNGPAFCAGLDLKEAASPAGGEKSADALSHMFAAIGNSPLVTIAAAHGAAMGGGAGLLSACDFVIAADDLTIAYPEVRRGLVAALVACLLRRQFSDRAVRELILLGQTIPAGRAMELGLVSQVVSAVELMSTAVDLAHRACRGAPTAIARSKRLLDALSPRPLEEDLRIAMTYHLASRHSPESAEGLAAFAEKREPTWGAREPEN